jgi:hypothetical protein
MIRVFRSSVGICMVLAAVAAQAPAATRVAVIGQDSALADDISLAYSKLASNSNIELLDREYLSKLMKEQALPATRPTDAQRAITNRKLVKAQVVAVVEHMRSPTEGVPRDDIVAFDAATGERLVDTPVQGETAESQGDALAAGIQAAVAKLATDRHQRRAICLLTTRNVDLPASDNGFCGGVATLLQRELLNSPSVVVLERERLGIMNQIRAATGDVHPDTVLRPSQVTIELDLVKSGPDGDSVLATTTLYDIHHNSLGSVHASGTPGGVGELASSLASDVLKALAAAPAGKNDPADGRLEAAQFERESQFRVAHRDWHHAAIAADAAYALMPDEPRLHILLARTLVMDGIADFQPRVDEDSLVDFSRTPANLDMDASLNRMHRATGELITAGKLPQGRSSLASTVNILQQFVVAVLEDNQGGLAGLTRADTDGVFSSPVLKLNDEQKKVLTAVMQNYRSYTVDVDEPLARADVHDERSLVAYSTVLLRLLGDQCHIFAANSNEYTAEVAKRLPVWALLAAKYATPAVQLYGPVEELIETAAWGWCNNHQWTNRWRPACFTKLDAVDKANWMTALEAIEKAKGPLRLSINLRPWVERIGTPPRPDELAVPRVAQIQEKPKQAAPAGALPLLFSKEDTLLNANAPDSDLELLNKPVLVGNVLYVAALAKVDDGRGREIRLLKMAADASDKANVLSRTPVAPAEVEKMQGDPNAFFQGPHFLGSSHFMLCTYDGDIFVQPLDGKSGRHISAAKELPGKAVLAATDLGDMLYLVLTNADQTGTYMVGYDLQSGHIETLVSSLRQERKSPFDDAAPMAVPFMVSDPDRDRIVFFAYHSQWENTAKGLWEYRGTGKFRKLRDTTYSRKENEGGYVICGSPVVDNTFILMTGVENLVYDLAADAPTKTIPDGLKRFHNEFVEPAIFTTWWHRYGNPGGSGVGFGDNTIERRIGDVHAFSQLWQGGYPSYSESMPDGRLLVSDETGVWLVTPR